MEIREVRKKFMLNCWANRTELSWLFFCFVQDWIYEWLECNPTFMPMDITAIFLDHALISLHPIESYSLKLLHNLMHLYLDKHAFCLLLLLLIYWHSIISYSYSPTIITFKLFYYYSEIYLLFPLIFFFGYKQYII